MKDKKITCRCGNEFIFTVGAQEFFKEKGYPDPKRCKLCRDQEKAKREKNARNNI